MTPDPRPDPNQEIVDDLAAEPWLEDFRRVSLKAPPAELRAKILGPARVARTSERRRLFWAAAAFFIVVTVGQSFEFRTPGLPQVQIGKLTIERPLGLDAALEARTRWLERLKR